MMIPAPELEASCMNQLKDTIIKFLAIYLQTLFFLFSRNKV